ncbi:MAG: RNA-binding protein, partial [Treponema sp.]|nr:RNA-binding protein [Treponema sp.]
MSTKIYIGNLSFSTTEETLQNKFESFGTIESVSIIRDKNTQMSKG